MNSLNKIKQKQCIKKKKKTYPGKTNLSENKIQRKKNTYKFKFAIN